jgi:hypothetical protein
MKILIVLFFILSASVQAQTNLRTIMVDSNGLIQRPTNFIVTNRIVSVATNGTVANPTNFWTANSNSINSVVSQSPYLSDRIFNRKISSFADLRTESVNSAIAVTNSMVSISIPFTNTNSVAATMLMASINNVGPAGVGTRFASDSHFAWINIDAVVREYGTFRAVLGANQNLTTNLAAYPTNRAVGFELTEGAGQTNQVRLIAHNGTTNTNGPWVSIGDVFSCYWIGVEQNKTSGEVKLYVGINAATPTNNTNATITGGPTNNASGGLSTLSAGVVVTNSNTNGNVGISIYSAFVDVID